MPAQMLDGAGLATRIRETLADEVQRLHAAGITPGLATVLVGDDPASASYVRHKHNDCAEVGIASVGLQLPATTTDAELAAHIATLNADPGVDAMLVQLPLPKGLDEQAALLAVDPDKDADGLHPVNLGRLVAGVDAPLACTPAAIIRLLAENGIDLAGRHVVIVGRGLTIGRPLALLAALKRPGCNAAVTVVHTGVSDLARYTRQADVLVAAAGSPGVITAEHVRPGAVVVGAGVVMDGRRLLSDVTDGVADVAGWMTPRVGGVGPMTRALLLENCVAAARRRALREGVAW